MGQCNCIPSSSRHLIARSKYANAIAAQVVLVSFSSFHENKTHLRVEALGNDVMVVRCLFRHGCDGLGIPGFVNNEPICGNEKNGVS